MVKSLDFRCGGRSLTHISLEGGTSNCVMSFLATLFDVYFSPGLTAVLATFPVLLIPEQYQTISHTRWRYY